MAMDAARQLRDEIVTTEAADGKRICLRSIRQSDELRMREGIAQLSEQSRYLRFFSVQPMPSDPVIDRLLDADGHDHIAWGAIHLNGDDNPAVGAVHAIRQQDQPRSGEFSIAVLDAYHGLGIARMLTTVLLIHCETEAICELEVQTLAENVPVIRFILSLGAQRVDSEAGVIGYRLPVRPAIQRISASSKLKGVQDILAALGGFVAQGGGPCAPGGR